MQGDPTEDGVFLLAHAARALAGQVAERRSGGQSATRGGAAYPSSAPDRGRRDLHRSGSWQFSFIRPEAERQIDFARFVLPVLDALGRMGLNAEMSARNDLTIDGKKVSGSAQYHHNGRVLHHGSILFARTSRK